MASSSHGLTGLGAGSESSSSNNNVCQTYEDIESLVAWPALEQFMDDLSDLDEQGNVQERTEPAPRAQDSFNSRERDLGLGKPPYGNYSRHSLLGGRHQLLSNGIYPPWQSPLDLPLTRGTGSTGSFGSVLSNRSGVGGTSSTHSLGSQLDLVNAAKADARISSQISSLMRERVEGGGSINSLLGSYRLSGLGSTNPPPPLRRPNGVPSPSSTGRPYLFGSTEEVEDTSMQQKQRFVWSPDLHKRFEAAVAQLGIEAAKPQAISQLMGVHGENAPTRQNIKSHLQKYRLLMKKRAASAEAGAAPAAAPASAAPPAAPPAIAPRTSKAGEGMRRSASATTLKEVGDKAAGLGGGLANESSEERRLRIEETLYKLDGLPPLNATTARSRSADDLTIEMHELGDIPMEALAMLDDHSTEWPASASGAADSRVRPLSGVAMPSALPNQTIEQGPISMHGQPALQQGIIGGQGVQQGELNLPHGLREALTQRHGVLQRSLPLPDALRGSLDTAAPLAADTGAMVQPGGGGASPHFDIGVISTGMDKPPPTSMREAREGAQVAPKPECHPSVADSGVQRLDSSDGSVSTAVVAGVSRHTTSSSDTWMSTWRSEELAEMLQDTREPAEDTVDHNRLLVVSPAEEGCKASAAEEMTGKGTMSASPRGDVRASSRAAAKDSAAKEGAAKHALTRQGRAERYADKIDRQLASAEQTRDKLSRDIDKSARETRSTDQLSPVSKRKRTSNDTAILSR